MKIIFLGSQGSGKSTQAKLLAQKLGLPCIEMGQIFRARAKDNDLDAFEIRKALELGELVPDGLAIKTLHRRLTDTDCKNGYVLDGYPRNYAQLEGLNRDIDRVFYVRVSDQEGIKRSIVRGRHDDNLKLLTRSLELYHKRTEPLLSYFRQKGILEEIDGERTIETIAKDVAERINNAKLESP